MTILLWFVVLAFPQSRLRTSKITRSVLFMSNSKETTPSKDTHRPSISIEWLHEILNDDPPNANRQGPRQEEANDHDGKINSNDEMIESSSASGNELLQALVQLVNDAYDVAEDGMWKCKGFRTNLSEIQQLILNQQLLVAIDKTSNDDIKSQSKLVGCIKVDQVRLEVAGDGQETSDDATMVTTRIGELGMLVVDPSYRRQGLGRRLMEAAEDWWRQQVVQGDLSGKDTVTSPRCANQMQLELLTPRHWKHPFKEFNKVWYQKMGYVALQTEPFERDFPHLVPLLATECDFTIWRKTL